jgi:hypothetical protein
LMDYIRRRQSDSLPILALLRLAAWIFQSDDQVGQWTALQEAPRLRGLLDQGQPAVLLLVCTSRVENPTYNHQVVATGYDFDADTQQFSVYLYDPNYPGEEPHLTLSLKDAEHGFCLEQSTGERRRGFIVQNYMPALPPAS